MTFFQDWKYKDKEAPVFWFTTTKILNEEQTISVSLFPQQIEELTKNVNHLFGVNKLFENYFTRYMSLTKREKEILVLLAREFTRKEISVQLCVAPRTAKKHCENIFKKLGTHSRNQISKIAAAFSTFK
ncbi:MAG: helix-turn-helix transcriptional regulator [Bacteroidota bacterium]